MIYFVQIVPHGLFPDSLILDLFSPIIHYIDLYVVDLGKFFHYIVQCLFHMEK